MPSKKLTYPTKVEKENHRLKKNPTGKGNGLIPWRVTTTPPSSLTAGGPQNDAPW